jgi:hypothetical protein
VKRFSRIVQVAGWAAVVAVNLFIIGSDLNLLSHAPDFQKAFAHFSEEHLVNETPFTLQLQWNPVPVEQWSADSVMPPSPVQLLAALLVFSLFQLNFFARRICLFRGEKMRATIFIYSIPPPPPKY